MLEEAKDVDETDDTVADTFITADQDSCQVCGNKLFVKKHRRHEQDVTVVGGGTTKLVYTS